MQTITVKTNINCSDCVEKVTPTLDRLVGEENWHVDTDAPDKPLTVQIEDNMSAMDVIAALKGAGYEGSHLA